MSDAVPDLLAELIRSVNAVRAERDKLPPAGDLPHGPTPPTKPATERTTSHD